MNFVICPALTFLHESKLQREPDSINCIKPFTAESASQIFGNWWWWDNSAGCRSLPIYSYEPVILIRLCGHTHLPQHVAQLSIFWLPMYFAAIEALGPSFIVLAPSDNQWLHFMSDFTVRSLPHLSCITGPWHWQLETRHFAS